MIKSIITLSILAFFAGSCGQRNSKQTLNTNKIMENNTSWYEQDKLDVEKFLENAEEKVDIAEDPVLPYYWFRKDFSDGRKIEISGGGERFERIETLPLPHFYQIYTGFHKNGNIERKGMQLIGGMYIGVFEYYDENGNKIKEMNWDEIYSDYDYNKFLNILHNEGIINLETGGNRDKITWISYDNTSKIWTVEFVYDETVGEGISYHVDFNTSPETVRKTIRK